jgi:hypothetical protein
MMKGDDSSGAGIQFDHETISHCRRPQKRKEFCPFTNMMTKSFLTVAVTLATALASHSAFGAEPAGLLPEPTIEPRIIQAPAGKPPSDAVVLFDGTDSSQWRADNGDATRWIVTNGNFQPIKGAGYVYTKQEFGDCQLHIEWATPSKVEGTSQDRGNSGVFFGGGRYEVQVLDSFDNKTYYHGQASAIYKQHAPLVNASRKPGEWQTYDIVYHGPRFDEAGIVTKPGTLTVFHNGVLTQDHAEILGTTSHDKAPKYEKHPVKQSLALQDHGNPVRFRNIWVREL